MNQPLARFDEYERLVVQMYEGTTPTETFLLTGGPIDDLGDGISTFIAYGHAAAAWARLENHLTLLLVQLNKDRHSTDLFDPHHPWQASHKLKRLKGYFNQHPALKAYTLSFRDLATDIKAASSERNNYMHSTLESYDSSTETVVFKNFQAKGERGSDTFMVRTMEVPRENLVHFAVAVVKLNRRLADITSKIFTADTLKQLSMPAPPTHQATPPSNGGNKQS